MFFRLPLVYFIGKTKNANSKQTIKRDGINQQFVIFFGERATKEVMKLLRGYIGFIIACHKKR